MLEAVGNEFRQEKVIRGIRIEMKRNYLSVQMMLLYIWKAQKDQWENYCEQKDNLVKLQFIKSSYKN